ncbi:ABC transporter ATP-binding protein [Acerihabitans arboris]|uniref:ATP-binding cassette domain-containing protein n=1 Tax=Acerihabitans arboris TaxID=2691583 RepID=A0A845SLG3_9GAMM|nr:ABC transporter ATP-binding protein [Acerihabitans arboris]NDL63408.1 ATP-binding cassette domain-containing protein [Acerihabitans arboris]
MTLAIDRIDNLSAVAPTGNGAGLSLQLNDVGHGFDFGGEILPVLEQISFSVAPGEFIALLGPSGCGKSTLLRLVAGLENPLSGELLEDGVPIRRPDPARVVVFQDPTLFPWRTVWANVALGLQAQGLLDDHGRRRVDRVLERVGLAQFAHAYPRQLSGGMAQRAALARALVNDPRLLILDEPLGKLDSLTRIRMQGELVGLWREKRYSVLMVTHDVEEALLMANRVLVFGPRPARILQTIDVELPYPRRRNHPDMIALRTRVLALLGAGADS